MYVHIWNGRQSYSMPLYEAATQYLLRAVLTRFDVPGLEYTPDVLPDAV